MMTCLNGYIGITDICKVDHAVMVPREGREDDCILADGYKRIRVFPIDKNFAINAIFDEKSSFVEFYMDMIKNIKLDEDNIPYMEDLYLDVVYTNKDEILIFDEDELEDALVQSKITKSEYDLSIRAKNEVVEFLKDIGKANSLKSYCYDNLIRLLPKVDGKEIR